MSNTLSAYRVPPMMERKAAHELREAGRRTVLTKADDAARYAA
jgi:hypothetical protein